METLLRQGIAIIMISSELPEILALSDRIIVLSQREDHRGVSPASEAEPGEDHGLRRASPPEEALR